MTHRTDVLLLAVVLMVLMLRIVQLHMVLMLIVQTMMKMMLQMVAIYSTGGRTEQLIVAAR